jgi:hypothetical protein
VIARNATRGKNTRQARPSDFLPWRASFKQAPRTAASSVDAKVDAFFNNIGADHAAG